MILTSSYQKIKETWIGHTGYGNVYLRIYGRVSQEPDIENNRYEVYAKSTLYVEVGSFTDASSGYRNLYCTGLNPVEGSSHGTFSGETILCETSGYVTHENDGTKSVTISSGYYSNYLKFGGTVEETVELPTIPRASSIAVSNVNLSQNVGITIGKKVDSFTSSLTYEIGTLKGTIIEKTSLSSYVWEMTEELIKEVKTANPSTKNVSAKILCTTYKDDTQIGDTKTAEFILTITDKPTISSIVRSELNTNISALTSAVLRHISENKFTITAAAPFGTTIKSYRVKTTTEDSGLFNTNEITLNNIQSFYEDEEGNLKTKFLITCIDERGNESETHELVCDFINYINVSFSPTDILIKRTNSASNDAIVSLNGNVYNSLIGETQNTVSIKYKYKKKEEPEYSELKEITPSIAGNYFKIENVTLTDSFDFTENYDFVFYVTDILNNEDEATYLFKSSKSIVRWHKNGADFNELSIKGNKVITFENLKEVTLYSTEEQKTSETWIDGRPIYKKVYIGTTENEDKEILESDVDIDFVDIRGQVINQIGTKYPLGHFFNGYGAGIRIENNDLVLYHTADIVGDYYVILKYAKNTD